MAFNTNYHDSGLFGVYAVTDRCVWARAATPHCAAAALIGRPFTAPPPSRLHTTPLENTLTSTPNLNFTLMPNFTLT